MHSTRTLCTGCGNHAEKYQKPLPLRRSRVLRDVGVKNELRRLVTDQRGDAPDDGARWEKGRLAGCHASE